VIRKSSAKIRKSVVDPLAANSLFRSVTSASSSLAVGLGGGGSGERDSSRGGRSGGSTAVSSAASSVRSIKSKSGALPVGMERTVSTASSVSTSGASVGIAGEAATGDDTDGMVKDGSLGEGESHDTTEKEDAAAAIVETVSILDPSHPASQSDEQVIKILETLGLKAAAVATAVTDTSVTVEAPGELSSGAASIVSSP
ncbi:hypothetical protein BGX24_005017, partial [Mortierella sp. AD032]